MDSIYIKMGYSVMTINVRLKSIPTVDFETAIRFCAMDVFVAPIMQRSSRFATVGVHQRRYFLSHAPSTLVPSITCFSKNRFMVMPGGGVYYKAPKSTPHRFGASIFLTDVVPPRMLYLLKFLEVVIPPADPDYMFSELSAYKDWEATVSYLRETFYPEWLAFRIYFHDFRCLNEASPYRKSAISREQGIQTIIAIYERILLPLSRLQGLLNRCFIHAAWP